MSIKLTDQEKFKIRELRNDPVYMGLMTRIADQYSYLPIFNPKEDSDPGQKYDKWVYSSGLVRGVQVCLGLLSHMFCCFEG